MLVLTRKLDENATWPHIVTRLTSIFLAFSLLALLVMNFDRYLATSYPIFHRTSVKKTKLLAVFGTLVIITVALAVISVNDSVISYQVGILIFFILVSSPMLYFNYKLLLVVKKNRKGNQTSPKVKKSFSLKIVSSCLLAVACYVTLSIPAFVYFGLGRNSTDKTLSLDSSHLTAIWAVTITSMNSTFNCLIFYWKNKVLRAEGWKVVKIMMIWRSVESELEQ
jgi:hypothetical protein